MVATLPLYEYQCPEHGTFEKMQKFSDPPLTACPTCGAPVEKLLSAPAIQFKGTGWYITDYARKSGGDSGREKRDSGGDKKETGAAKESKDSPAKGGATPSPSTETKKASTETKK